MKTIIHCEINHLSKKGVPKTLKGSIHDVDIPIIPLQRKL